MQFSGTAGRRRGFGGKAFDAPPAVPAATSEREISHAAPDVDEDALVRVITERVMQELAKNTSRIPSVT